LEYATHMTLYSDRSLLVEADVAASDWYARHLGGEVAGRSDLAPEDDRHGVAFAYRPRP
jgi:hypothetical protein